MLAKLDFDYRCVMGEHDYYLDLGEYWSELFGPQYYSWDHKGVHFVTLNSILTYDKWTHERWPSNEQRMLEMAGLDNPNGSPFMVGEKQREWLRKDLAGVSKDTPIVLFSHSPIQKIYKGWNFWTEDAEDVQALLKPFDNATVVYGHVHQIQYNQIDNISFHAVMATAWPWPYPESYAQAESHLPKLTVPMNRADPFFERDATGWQLIDLATGRIAERAMPKKIAVAVVAVIVLALIAGGRSNRADEFTDEDVKRWQDEYMSVVQTGRELWVSAELGTNGVACAQCHPNAANTHPETYPKFQQQLGRVIALRDMINWCLQQPLEGEPLALDDPRLLAMEAYATYERRGVALDPGKH